MSAVHKLVPKASDGTLRILVIGRVSTIHQPDHNIEAGYDYAKRCLKERYQYDGPLHVKHLGERGSGMRTDRETMFEAYEALESGLYDIVLMEDLSKPYRNPRWIYAFVQDAVDLEARVIAPGDCLDTADENWEVNLASGALRHGLYIPDTRRRVRRTGTYSFHQGGMVQKVRFGYRKLTKEEAASGKYGPKGLRLAKLPECTPTIRAIKDRVMQDEMYEDISDWLNEQGISPGPFVKSGKWTGQILVDFIRDLLLHGERRFRQTIYEPVFKTGKHRRKKNPNPEMEYYPDLAHLSKEEHDELLRYMKQRAEDHPGLEAGPTHPLSNKPRSRVPWPQQHPRCAICKDKLERYGTASLKCRRAHRRGPDACWNHVQVTCGDVREKVLGWLFSYSEAVPSFRTRLAEAAWQQLQHQRQQTGHRSKTDEKEIKDLKKREANLAEAIARGGELEALLAKLAEVQQALKSATTRMAKRSEKQPLSSAIQSQEEVEAQLNDVIAELARTSYELADLMRRIIPEFWIQPVQSLEGQVRPRAKLTISLAALNEPAFKKKPYEPREGDFSIVIDLFEPPDPIRYMQQCLDAKAQHPKWGLRKIGMHLGINYMTVKRAFAYARRMKEAGWSTPYRELTEQPESASRWKSRRKSA